MKTHPPATEASDSSIAQAFREMQRDVEMSRPHRSGNTSDAHVERIVQRARELDASAPAAAVDGVVLTPAEEDDVAFASREQLLSERDEVLKDYVDDYEYLGADADGRDGCYRPNERERILIEDAIRGWEALEVAMPSPAAPAGEFVVEQVNVADVAVSQGNWGQYDGSTIIGWRVSAETLREMGMSSMCLPKEIGEDLERLRTIATWWETGAKDRMAKLEAALKESLPDDRDTRVRLWGAILPLVYAIEPPAAQPSAKVCNCRGDAGECPVCSQPDEPPSAKDGVMGDGVVIDESLARDLIEYAEKGKVAEPWMVKLLLEAHSAQATTAAGLVDGDNHKLDTDTHVFFYEQDFYVLSNFSAFSLQWDGWRFDTSEAAYHYEKFKFHAPEICDEVRTAPSAHEAFKIAERNKHLRNPEWDNVKLPVMRTILRAKADQHEYVRRKLLATGDRILVEDSWRDGYWGWGQNRDGQNMLGKLWMEVRENLRREAAIGREVGG